MYRDFGLPRRHLLVRFRDELVNNHMAHTCSGSRKATATDAFSTPWLWSTCTTASMAIGGVAVAPPGTTSTFALQRGQTGAAWACTCAAHEGLRGPRRRTRTALHAGTHYHSFYSAEGRGDQLRFLDPWLKGEDTGSWKSRRSSSSFAGRPRQHPLAYEHEWPLSRTRWTRLYLEPARRGNARHRGQARPRRPTQGHLGLLLCEPV